MITATIKEPKTSDYASIEAMNTICSNLLFLGTENKVVLLTSSAAHDGKSYVGMRILQNLTQRGKKVLLIDADLRKSRLEHDYSITFSQETQGLAHYLAGMCTVDDIVCKTNIANGYLIPIGQHISNTVPLLSSPRLEAMLKDVSQYFDLILIDAPPIGCVVDAAIMAKQCDGVILVAAYNQTTKRDLYEVKRQLQLSGCKILGCIINKVSFSSLSAKKYYNKSYYNRYMYDYSKDGK